MELYKLQDVIKKYDKQVAFSCKALTLESNKLIAIVGNSGSGKSTLLKLLANITKPTYGNVIFQGEDITKFKLKQTDNFFKNSIDVIFQEYNLIENLTVFENLELLKSINKQITDEQINELLIKLGIESTKDKLASDISGGEAQRTAIARALLKQTNLILADEPTGALDVENTKVVIDMFRNITKENKSIVFVTHDLKCAISADVIYVINDGKIVKQLDNSNQTINEVDLEDIFTNLGDQL